MTTPSGDRQRGSAVIVENAPDLMGLSRLPVSARPPGSAGNNGDAVKLAPTRDVSTLGVGARRLGSADSRSARVIGWAGGSVSGVAEGAERAVLLATKVHVPAIGGQLVERGALLEALSAGRGRKLTLLSAPAGWANTGDQAREALIERTVQRASIAGEKRWGWPRTAGAANRGARTCRRD